MELSSELHSQGRCFESRRLQFPFKYYHSLSCPLWIFQSIVPWAGGACQAHMCFCSPCGRSFVCTEPQLPSPHLCTGAVLLLRCAPSQQHRLLLFLSGPGEEPINSPHLLKACIPLLSQLFPSSCWVLGTFRRVGREPVSPWAETSSPLPRPVLSLQADLPSP